MTAPSESSDDPLVFTPVATASNRHDGWTADRQHAFIAILAQHGGVAAAARAVGMTPQTARRLLTRPGAEGFARAWDVAIEEGRMRSLEAITRGRDGWLVPVIRAGRFVGHRRRYDDRLLFAACYGVPMSRYERQNSSPGWNRCRFPGTFGNLCVPAKAGGQGYKANRMRF